MDDSRRFARLGLFVIASAIMLVMTLVLLGGRDWFQPSFTFETYFNNSIAGLDLGAPVRFRGVPLGQVTQILTSAATYERDVPLDRRREYIVVRVKVNLSAREAEQMRQDAAALVSRGLRAQTQLAGITGQQYLALDFMEPGKYPPLPFEWSPRYTYLPSAPSSVGEIVAKAQTFLASLNEADIRQLGQNLNRLVADVDRKLSELQVAELSGSARQVLADADVTLKHVDGAAAHLDVLMGDPAFKETLRNVAAISGRLRTIADDGDVEHLLQGINQATGRLDVLLGDNQYDIREIVENLRFTSDNLRALSETIRRDPAGVLVGAPPKKVQLPGAAP